jgi:hypothetical protein
MPPRRRRKAAPISAIERAAKRAEQKAAGVFDGRFRPRVVKNKKRYTRKRADPADEQ